MSLSIQTNVNSLIAQENLRVNSDFQAKTIQRLTSGYRINQSGDDAAGLAVANKFRSDVSELTQGVRNANDGLSTLQIVDGGLNNISRMLDRLQTLASQSASATFSGNRTTLNNEYQDLLKEIDRQAANVGLSTGTWGGRYNADISVYTGGGGDQQSNSKVSINLAGSANKIDSTGLLLAGTTVLSGSQTLVDITNEANMSGTNKVLAGGASQTFEFNITETTGATHNFNVTVTGTTAGITGSEVVSQLNAAIAPYGLNASLDSNSHLQFSGSSAWNMRTAAQAGGVFTANTAATNDTVYTAATAATFVAFTADNEAVSFKVGNNTVAFTLDSTNAGSLDAAVATLNSKLNTLGIMAVKNTAAAGTSGISLQSAVDFTYSVNNSNGTPAEGVFIADVALAADNGINPTNTSGTATSAAEAANLKITAAVKALGLVQGVVGTAQNKLQYAINLAQSQISNFSAADSRIRDADVAAEAANLTKASVLQQASMAAMAQANSAPQAVLTLLRG